MEFQNTNVQSMESNVVPSKHNKNKFFILVFFLLIIVVAVFGYVLTRPKITGLEAAEKTALFLEKTFKDDGGMFGGFYCDNSSSDVCAPVELSLAQPHVGQAIYSFYSLSEATGILYYREKADKAINSVLDRCDVDVRVCEWNYFPIVQYYQKTGEEKYLTRGMLRPAENFLKMTNKDTIEQNIGHKLASLFNATKDVKYKNRLLEVADEELAKGLGVSGQPHHDIQVAWSVFLPAYKITNNAKYLTAIENFFNTFSIVDTLGEFNQPDLMLVNIKGAEVLLELAELSEGGKIYKKEAHAILQNMILKLWDTPEDPKFNGDYAFVNVKMPIKTQKSTLNNGWIIKLLIKMADDRFVAPKAR